MATAIGLGRAGSLALRGGASHGGLGRPGIQPDPARPPSPADL